MASNDDNSSWWGNWIKTAKEKSKTALEIMKTDLAEFTSTMTTDLNQASAQLIDPKATQSFISSTLSYITGESENITRASDTSSSTINIKTSLQDRYKEELCALQTNENTYLTDPRPEVADEFSEWFATFDPDNYKPEISNLLIEQADLRLLYSQLVPAKASNAQFWGRYFFKVNLLEEDHKKRAKLLERADEVITTDKQTTDWDEDLEEENKTIEKEVREENAEIAESLDTETTTPKDEQEKSQEEPDLKTNLELTESTANDEEVEDQDDEKMISSPSSSQIVVDADSIEVKSDSSASSTSNMSNKGQLVSKLETSQKTEDSDDWEKVSEASEKTKPSGDADEETTAKFETENDGQDEEGANDPEEEEEEGEDLNKTPTSKKEESDEKESKPSKSKNKNEDDWDDWE